MTGRGPYGVKIETFYRLNPSRPIVQYWINRFPHRPGDGTESFFRHAILKRPSAPGEFAVSALLTWLGQVDSAMTGAQRALAGRGLQPLGPALPR